MHRFTRIAAAATAASLLAACGGHNGTIPSQTPAQQHTNQAYGQQVARPHPIDYVPRHYGAIRLVPGQQPSWNGSYRYNGTTYTYTMLGANPATNNATTTIPVDIIPVKVVVGSQSFDPETVLSDGNTAVQQTADSPIYKTGLVFRSGGHNVGQQYLDAFQRGNFWNHVHTHTAYHLKLGAPSVQAEQTINGSGTGSPFGITVGFVDINTFDSFIQNYLAANNIPPSTEPVFMTYDVYLTENGGCCIGGYHDFNGTNTYMHFTYINNTGGGVTFSQDVGALSHETGEYFDDPFVNNTNNPCGGLLEVGDPLENEANYGLYSYAFNGFTYHLQDLTYLPYFGAPPSTSVNNQFTFQGTHLSVCQNGQ